jgi:small GTP-binding protein
VAKVLVVGNVATGKTCIIRRYTRNEFSSDYQTTIGVDFSLKSLNVDGVDINVQLWVGSFIACCE